MMVMIGMDIKDRYPIGATRGRGSGSASCELSSAYFAKLE